jgi:hypothetical protein
MRRSTERRLRAIERARRVVNAVADGSRDPYEGYRELYSIYLGSGGNLEELKPLFRLPGIEADGCIHVDDEFRGTIRAAAANWLKSNPS